MSILRMSFFLFVFLFHSFGYSEPVEEVVETVESVFINFVTDLLLEGHITNVEEELNRLTAADWSNDISNATENWTASEARAFLNVLMSSGIAHRSILNILQATDYIKAIKSEHHFRFSGQLRPALQRQNASKVFFEFIQKSLGPLEIADRMEPGWREDISHHTRYWPIEDAEYFLASLLDLGFSLNSILRLLQAPDYLEKLRAEQISFEFFQTSAISVEAVSLETSQQVNSQDIIETQSAADIFIAGAKQYFRTEFEQQRDNKYKNMSYEEAFQKEMGSDWEDKLRRYTQYWTVQDAHAFLNYLSNRIGETIVLKRIKGASYFKTMGNYNRFLARVKFYENHIGEDKVTYRLSKSLAGFERGDIEEIKRVIEFLEGYLGSREIVVVMIKKSLKGFSRLSGKANAQTNLKNIEDVIAYLRSIEFTEEQIQSMIFENFDGFARSTRKKLETKRQSLTKGETIGMVFTLGEIDKMIEESIEDFLRADLRKVKMMVAYLKEIGIEDDKIKEMAIRNLQGLAKGDPKTLERKRQSLTQTETIGMTFNLGEIDKMIEENIQGFLRADLRKVKEMVAYLKEIGIEDDKIKEMAIRNLKGLAQGDPKTLESKRQSLTQTETVGMTFNLGEIDKMIEENIQGFLYADLRKVKLMVAYLKEIKVEDDKIKEMAIRNLKGLAQGDPKALESKRQSLTQTETIGMIFSLGEIDKMIEESIEGFLRADLIKVKMMVVYLKKIRGEDDKIKDMAIRNLQGLAKGDPETLESKRQSLTQTETVGMTFTLGEIDKMIEENIQSFLRTDLRKVKMMVAYLKEIGIEDDKIKEMAIGNLLGLAKGDPKTLESKRQSLTKEETIGMAFSLGEIDKMIEENIQGFLYADLRKVKLMVAYLKEIKVEDDKIKKMVIRNLQGLAKGDPETLESKRQSLTQTETVGMTFNLGEIDKMIEENIQGFLYADLRKVKLMVAYLKEIKVEDDKIKKMVIRNSQGLAKGDPETLESKRQSLTQTETVGMTFTLNEVDKMIEESIQDFLQADLRKVKMMVAYLKEIGIEDDKIKEMAIRNLKGLAQGDPKTLESKRQSLRKEETIGMAFNLGEIDKMIEENIQGFLQADLRKVKMMVAYLKEIGIENGDIKDRTIRDLLGFSIIKKYELRDMIKVLKNEPQLSNVKEETLMTRIREMIRTQSLVNFYYGFDNDLKTLICTRALSK